MEGMLQQDVRGLDVVLSTTELLDLIQSYKDFFTAIPIDNATAVNWHPDMLFTTWLTFKQTGSVPPDIQGATKIFTVESHPFFTNSSGENSTSNNYLNQVLIKAVFDKTNQIIQESSIVEKLRKNKKGYSVHVCNQGNRYGRSFDGPSPKRRSGLWIQKHPKFDSTGQDEH